MDRVERRKKGGGGGGGVYVQEQEEGESRVEFSNIWNQSVCERRRREGAGWMDGDWTEEKERRKEGTE